MYLVISDIGTDHQNAMMELPTLGAAIRACEDLREQWKVNCPGHTLCVRHTVDVVDHFCIDPLLLWENPWPLRSDLEPEPV